MGEQGPWIRVEPNDKVVLLALRVRNIGPGPAHLGTADYAVELRGDPDIRISGHATSYVVAPKESTIVYFGDTLTTDNELWRLLRSTNVRTIDARVRYADIGRTHWVTSVLRLGFDPCDLVQVEAGHHRPLSFVELLLVDDEVGSAN